MRIVILVFGALLLAFGLLSVIGDARDIPIRMCYQENGIVTADSVVDIDHPITERTLFPFGGATCQWTLNNGNEYVVTSRMWPSVMVVAGALLVSGVATATAISARKKKDQ